MPAYKDKNGTWYVKFYYTDYEGHSRQKLKRGFSLKREGEEWERQFLQSKQFQPDMPFQDFVQLYMQDIKPQNRLSTYQRKNYQLKRILPYFQDKRLNSITSKDIKHFHNSLIQQGFQKGYIMDLHRLLSAIFNHAMRYYGLSNNPVRQAGAPKTPNQGERQLRFWTLEEFNAVIREVNDLKAKTALLTLYWTGMRKGELYALTWDRIDFINGTITIERSFQRIRSQDVITPTKTGISRTIKIPGFLVNQLKEYKEHIYNPAKDSIVFPYSKFIEKAMKEASSAAGVKNINVHGLRHSHASYLINSGVNIVLISKRLGHAKISTTLDVYSHFFPTAEEDLINQMEEDFSSDTKTILENFEDKTK